MSIGLADALHGLTGESEAIRNLDRQIDLAARTDAKVLIVGESGTGKEVAARLIQVRSRRSGGPFVTINCAGVPETLLESELFGYERGSFTGAYRDRAGLLEQADRGTLFLDEIGEMSLRMQGLLLRFLETGEIQRVGSDRRNSRLDVRVLTATNRDLAGGMSTGEFRRDLYYRLNVLHLRTPSLRERRDDIPALVDHFLDLFSGSYGLPRPRLCRDAMAEFCSYAWPGNVRELRNVVERLVVAGHHDTIGVTDLPPEMRVRAMPVSISTPTCRADVVFDRIVKGRESFWSVVYTPFMARDLTRDDVRTLVAKGLERTGGSYTQLVQLFNMPMDDYKRFLNFLRKHQVQVQFQAFRSRGTGSRPSAIASA